MTCTCNQNSALTDAFDVTGDFVMNSGSTLNISMCCDDDGQSSGSGSTPGTIQNDFIVNDVVMTAGTAFERSLSNNQMAYNLLAYALKEETSGSTVNQLISTGADSLVSLSQSQEHPVPVEKQISRTITQSAGNVIQTMSSNSEKGQTLSSSHAPYGSYPLYRAFDGTDHPYFSSTSTHPQTLAIEFDQPKSINSYRLAARLDHVTDRITRFTLQGSNDGNVWTDIDDQSASDITYNAEHWYESATFSAVTYTHFRLYITKSGGQGYPSTSGFELISSGANTVIEKYQQFTPTSFSNQMTIQAFDNAASAAPVLLERAGIYYTLSSGALTPTTFSSVADIAANGFTSSTPIDVSSLAAPFNIISTGSTARVTSTLSGYAYEPTSLFDMTSHGQLNAVNISAPASTAITVQTVVGNYLRWNGVSWVTASGVTDGNKASDLNALTASDWAALGTAEIGFSYFNTSSNVDSATATLNFVSSGGASTGAWLLCDASEVRIRWYEDKVTFTAAQDGNYKLAYQDAA